MCRTSALPIAHRNQRNSAWTNKEIFSEWFEISFLPEIETRQTQYANGEKTVLSEDSANSHLPRERSIYQNFTSPILFC